MNIQIKSIIIYNKNGQYRRLDFKLGELNIISGEQNTGKSAIIPIIDYCLGNSTLEIHSGVVTDIVSFYAVLYQLTDRQVLIAKPAPYEKNSFQAYYEENEKISIPTNSVVFKNKLNADNEDIVQNFSRLLGISTTKISIREAIPFLFQEKSILDNHQKLFSGGKDEEMQKSLLYFLKTQQDDDLENQARLSELDADFKKVKRKINQLQKSDEEKILQGQNLLRKAQSIGLFSSEVKIEVLEDIKNPLLEITKLQQQPSLKLPENEPNTSELEKELQELRKQLEDIDYHITELKEFDKLSKKYSLDAEDQINRLKSIDLFPSHDDLFRQGKKCPLCDSVLENELPKVSGITKVLNKLEDDLKFVKTKEAVNLEKQINGLNENKKKLLQQLTDKKSALNNYYKEKNVLSQFSKQHNEKMEIVGAIKFYLYNLIPARGRNSLMIHKEKLEKEISSIERKIQADSSKNFDKESTFRWLSEPMRDWAIKLCLEDNGSNYHFDFDKLTIIADRKGFPLTMSKMRGNCNWAGCHIIALLALHKAFLERQSSIPSFIVFDQPPEENITATLKLFTEVCKELSHNLQIIVMTHAILEVEFENTLVEPYWTANECALVPNDWIKT